MEINDIKQSNHLKKAALIILSVVGILFLALFLIGNIPGHYRYTADYPVIYREQLKRFFGDYMFIRGKEHVHVHGGKIPKAGDFDYYDDFERWTIYYKYNAIFGADRTVVMENRNDEVPPWREWLLEPMEEQYRTYIENRFGLHDIPRERTIFNDVSVDLKPLRVTDDAKANAALDSFWDGYFAPLDGGEEWPVIQQYDIENIFARFPLYLDVHLELGNIPRDEVDEVFDIAERQITIILQEINVFTGGTLNASVLIHCNDTYRNMESLKIVAGETVCNWGESSIEFDQLLYDYYENKILQ